MLFQACIFIKGKMTKIVDVETIEQAQRLIQREDIDALGLTELETQWDIKLFKKMNEEIEKLDKEIGIIA